MCLDGKQLSDSRLLLDVPILDAFSDCSCPVPIGQLEQRFPFFSLKNNDMDGASSRNKEYQLLFSVIQENPIVWPWKVVVIVTPQ